MLLGTNMFGLRNRMDRTTSTVRNLAYVAVSIKLLRNISPPATPPPPHPVTLRIPYDDSAQTKETSGLVKHLVDAVCNIAGMNARIYDASGTLPIVDPSHAHRILDAVSYDLGSKCTRP